METSTYQLAFLLFALVNNRISYFEVAQKLHQKKKQIVLIIVIIKFEENCFISIKSKTWRQLMD